MTDKEQTYLEMMIGCYVTGKMHQNYIQSVIKPHKAAKREGKYLHNKLDQAFQAIAKELTPLELYLKNIGGLEAMEDSIMQYHELTDEIYGLDSKGLKRVKNLITKIKKEAVE